MINIEKTYFLRLKLSQGKDISSLPDSQKVDSMFKSINADVLYIYISEKVILIK